MWLTLNSNLSYQSSWITYLNYLYWFGNYGQLWMKLCSTLYSNTIWQAFLFPVICDCHTSFYSTSLSLKYSFKSLCLLSFVQIKSPVVSGGVVGWGEWLGPGGHDVGNTDVLVSEEGNPPVPGKAATGQLKVRGNHKERLRRWDHESRCVGEYESKGQSQEWCQGQEWVDEGQRLASHVSDLRL